VQTFSRRAFVTGLGMLIVPLIARAQEGEKKEDAEKKREELICGLTGWRCIRVTWGDLHRSHATVSYIRSVLAGGPVH